MNVRVGTRTNRASALIRPSCSRARNHAREHDILIPRAGGPRACSHCSPRVAGATGLDSSKDGSRPHGFFGPPWNFLGGLCRQSYWFSLCFRLIPRARGESALPRAHMGLTIGRPDPPPPMLFCRPCTPPWRNPITITITITITIH